MKPEDQTRIADLVSKTIVVSLLGLGINSLSNISSKTSDLNESVIGLKGQIQILSERQGDMNRILQERIERIEKRIERLEELRR